MGDSVFLAVIAIGIGGLVGVVLFVPFVAIQYRRAGRLTAGQVVLWSTALVYFFAIWTYTLLPLPDPTDMRCTGVNLDLFALVDDIRGAADRAGAARAPSSPTPPSFSSPSTSCSSSRSASSCAFSAAAASSRLWQRAWPSRSSSSSPN